MTTQKVTGDDLVKAAEGWLRSRIVSGRASSNAGDKARRSDIGWWARQLTGNAPDTPYAVSDFAAVTPDMLTPQNIIDVLYQEQTKVPPAQPQTLARRLSTLRNLCRHFALGGLIDRSPFEIADLRVHVPAGGDPKAIDETELEQLILGAANPPERMRAAWPVRDVALILVLADCGLRAAEAAALLVGDVEFTDPQALRVRRATKGSKARTVPFGPDVATALRALIAEYERAGMRTGPGSLVFRRRNGLPLAGNDLWYLIRRLAGHAGVALPNQAAVHALRHRFGTQLSLRGVPIATLMELLGHSSAASTAIYTRNNAAQLAGALDDAGWLERRRPAGGAR